MPLFGVQSMQHFRNKLEFEKMLETEESIVFIGEHFMGKMPSEYFLQLNP
jgi:hypothetical protein